MTEVIVQDVVQRVRIEQDLNETTEQVSVQKVQPDLGTGTVVIQEIVQRVQVQEVQPVVVEHLESGTVQVIEDWHTGADTLGALHNVDPAVDDLDHPAALRYDPATGLWRAEPMEDQRVATHTTTPGVWFAGCAPAGSLETEAVWLIQRIAVDELGGVSTDYAGGDTEYSRRWDLRETYTY